jgi:tetratricopeptide (TPR) repeat protein
MTSIHSVCLVSLAMLLSPLTRGEDFARQGKDALEKKDYDKAIADFTEAIKVNPKDTAKYREGASAYEARKCCDKAISDFTEAIRLDGGQVTDFENRAHAFYSCLRLWRSGAVSSGHHRLQRSYMLQSQVDLCLLQSRIRVFTK